VPSEISPLARERTREFAERFLEEMRHDIRRSRGAGTDVLPRLRCVNERAGHATPEYRTLIIPMRPGGSPLTPIELSSAIAYYASRRPPDRLLLAMDALHANGGEQPVPVLIAEARDHDGTRLFMMQPYRPAENGQDIVWEEPLHGGWVDPGEEDMILDAAFHNGEVGGNAGE
jgi:hypothetical protein